MRYTDYPKICFLLVILVVFCLGPCTVLADEGEIPKVEIVAIDPDVKTQLGSDEKLYAKIAYESKVPLRFQAIAMRDAMPLQFGAITNPGALYAPGQGEALAWIFYTNLTHVDSVRVIVRDQKWRELTHVDASADVTWLDKAADTKREPAEWVDDLVRADRRKTDFVYDPSPRRFGLLFDIFFALNVFALPAYILLQLHMLYRYRGRWRELAMIPIVPYLIVAFYVITDLGIDRALIITFTFRYTFAALLWLIVLWIAKRYWQDKLPPVKSNKSPQE